MKKIFSLIILITIAINTIAMSSFAYNEVIRFNNIDNTVSINCINTDLTNYKIIVKKGLDKYIYDLFSTDSSLPLQMGNGEYTVNIYKKIQGTSYTFVSGKRMNIKIDEINKNDLYLTSIQNIDLINNKNTIEVAERLTEDLDNDMDILKALHNYLITNIKYDYYKAGLIKTYYNPNPDDTINTKKGICYDYASTLGVMLRSLNIPTKLIKGTADGLNGYHAWNEVFIDEKWLVIDTTVDSSLNIIFRGDKSKYNMIKNSEDYHSDREY